MLWATAMMALIIMRPENILHSEAGYIFADCSRRIRFFLQFSGGPYNANHLFAPLCEHNRLIDDDVPCHL
jgi:hypothetical protein